MLEKLHEHDYVNCFSKDKEELKLYAKKTVIKNYIFLGILLGSMVLGGITEWAAPKFADRLAPFGKVFINMMFCIVVPLVFASISSSVAKMKSKKRAGKILGTTIATFVITGTVAAVIMFVLMKMFPPVLHAWKDIPAQKMGEVAPLSEIIVNFFTADDFVGLLTRKAMLPLIIFSLLFGFATNSVEKGDGPVTEFLDGLANVMLKFVNIVTYYAPIAFFAIFAGLVASFGSMITESYGRAMVIYYPVCVIFFFTAFPLFARIGGGKGAVKVMFRHITRPVVVSLGTCSSVATIPTNMHVAEQTGISKDVSEMVISFGATMHMDGSCFACVLKIAFLFGVFGREFSWEQMIPVVLVAVFSSVGMSGVPGGGYIGEYIVCSIFFPAQMEFAFPILVAIGNLVDPIATMINSSGDYAVLFLVSRIVDGKDWLQKKMNRMSQSNNQI